MLTRCGPRAIAGPDRQRPQCPHMQSFDVIVLGAGAAGLFCAGIAGQRGLRVLLLDHAPTRSPRRSASPAAGAATSPTATAARRTSCPRTPPSAARRWRATRRPTSSRWCSATASPSTKSTTASCSATNRREQIIDDAAGRMRRRRRACTGSRARCARCVTWRRASSSTPSAARCARPSWWSPPAACRSRRSAPATWATAWPVSSATASSNRGRALVPLSLRCRHLGAVRRAGRRVAAKSRIEAGTGKAARAFVEDLLFTHRGLSGPGRAADLELLAPGRRHCASTWRRGSTSAHGLRRRKAAVAPATRQRTGRCCCRSAWPRPGCSGARAGRRAAACRRCATATSLAWRDSLQRWQLVPSGSEG